MRDQGRAEPWRELLHNDSIGWFDALWGKSDAAGRPNLLLQHLFDAMAVGELIWDEYLADGPKCRLDVAMSGGGRRVLVWLCGLHDIGKATPAFQSHVRHLADRVHAAGLSMSGLRRTAARDWRHEIAGGRIVFEYERALREPGERRDTWVWPLIAGHHGQYPGISKLQIKSAVDSHGRGPTWGAAQRLLVDVVSVVAGFRDADQAFATAQPSKADQLLLSGLIIMADWIASAESLFDGVDRLSDVGLAAARERAGKAWSELELRGGWRELSVVSDVIQARFGRSARPSQATMIEAARTIPAPGLLILEAPMGEGKTEAALASAEVLAARFGADGVFVGMPTQATADPMFRRFRSWASTFGQPMQLALLHGKREFNAEWHGLRQRHDPSHPENDGGDPFGVENHYGTVPVNVNEAATDDVSNDRAAAEWFLGSKKGLLAPFVVATIDQLLFAATRSRHVMLRYAGLAGKVIVLDEVHAADIYMEQFLNEALWWFGRGAVPVVLLSATLAPEQRVRMIESYLAGALGNERVQGLAVRDPEGYPNITRAWMDDDGPHTDVLTASPWRSSTELLVDVLDEDPSDELAAVASTIEREMSAGGCVLVIRNTVPRAQRLYERLQAVFREDVVLLHGRFAIGDRTDVADELVESLGPEAQGGRPRRLIVVATQVAEQSFDVDVDLLLTDLAPIDLIFQRAGRLHRHDRASGDRPEPLRRPRVLVTGFQRRAEQAPWVDPGSESIYGRYLLLRTAAVVGTAAMGHGWRTPDDVPRLIAEVYGDADLVPDGWRDEEHRALETWRTDERNRRTSASTYVLTPSYEHEKRTLEGLHAREVPEPDEKVGRVLVRDGDPSVEVVLVRHDGRGFRTLDGSPLGIDGDEVHFNPELERELMRGAVRLPSSARMAAYAAALQPLPGWRDHPRLKYVRALCLDRQEESSPSSPRFSYTSELGLVVERRP